MGTPKTYLTTCDLCIHDKKRHIEKWQEVDDVVDGMITNTYVKLETKFLAQAQWVLHKSHIVSRILGVYISK